MTATAMVPPPARAPIAIIGMSCRAAGVETLAELWDVFQRAEQRFTPVPEDRWPGLDPGVPLACAPRAALLDRVDEFGARFFGIAPRMAAWMDPQQRLILELAWEAVENAGLEPGRLAGEPVAVFIGGVMSDYRERMSAAQQADSAALPGALSSFLANRVSYQFDWTGPSMVVDSACSSSLTALALAVQGLRNGDFPMAVVGAPNVLCNGFYANTAYRGGALSRSGKSVPFGADRDGYLRGEGGACLLLKDLSAAIADGDPVQGVILAAATAHKGRAGGLTGADVASQVRLLRRTAELGGRQVCDVGYLEAHATGTSSGDAVEVAAVAEALAGGAPPAGPGGRIWVGSGKSNLGHLEGAAGLIGLVKAVLAMRHGRIPANAGLSSPDPALPIGEAPLAIADRLVDWPASGRPRLAAVSAFGLGGSLSQVLVEEAPAVPPRAATARGVRVIPLSADTQACLAGYARRLRREFAVASDTGRLDTLASFAWTLQDGRSARPVRRAIVAADPGELSLELAHIAAADAAETMAAGPPADDSLAAKLARAWAQGRPVDWTALWPGADRPVRLSLPSPPFDRRSYWFDRRPPAPARP